MKQTHNHPQNPLLTFTVILLACTFIFGFFLPMTIQGQEKKKIYDPALNVKAAITTALVQAKKENKHIILMFGGNWCPWCHRLHQLLQSDPAIKEFLAAHFLLILVDIGETAKEPLNRDLVTQYGLQGMGYPSLVVLSTEGKRLCSQASDVLEKDKGHNPEKVMGFLKAEAPSKQ